MLDEKQSIGEDQRKMEMQERMELIRQGNVLNPTNLEQHSVLLNEQKQQEQAALQQQAMQQQIAQEQMNAGQPGGAPSPQ